MGLLELVLLVFAAVISGALVVAGRRLLQSGAEEDLGARPPLPIPLFAAALVGLAAAPGLGWVLSPALVEYVAGVVPGDLVLTAPADAWIARFYAALSIATWVAVPSVGAVVWLLFSSRRSAGSALVFAGAAWIGCTFGMSLSLLSFGLVYAAASPSVLMDGVGAQLRLLDVMSSGMRSVVGLGLFGALVGAVGVMAASSARGSRVALLTTTALPFVAALTAAVVTPPDPLSLLALGVPLVVIWLVALGVGSAARAALSRLRPGLGAGIDEAA